MNLFGSLLIFCFVLSQHIKEMGATFGASCMTNSDCSTPEEFCSGANCACSTGYVHDGNGVCIGVDCGTPTDPTNGAISVTGTLYQNTGTVTCNSGYSLIGSSTITCSSSGSWTTIPTCSSGSIQTHISSKILIYFVIILNICQFSVNHVI